MFNNKNSNECLEALLSETDNILNIMAPIKRLSKKEIKLQKLPWITNGILKSIQERDKTHKKYISEPDEQKRREIFQLYKRKRNLLVSLIRKSKTNHFVKYFEENKSNVKKTWQGIRNIVNIAKKERILPNKVSYKDRTASSHSEIAGLFNNFFVNIGNTVENKIPKSRTDFLDYLSDENSKSVYLRPVDDLEVICLLRESCISKSSGPNSIPSNLLKTHMNIFASPISEIINLSFSEGTFPNLLKMASVCPIYKKNNRNKCENYRPISLLSNISKLFEKCMHSRLYNFLEECNIFYKLQFGFRKKYSTNHALLSIVEHIREKMDNKMFTCGVFIDLEKAFDTVNHEILIKSSSFMV